MRRLTLFQPYSLTRGDAYGFTRYYLRVQIAERPGDSNGQVIRYFLSKPRSNPNLKIKTGGIENEKVNQHVFSPYPYF